MASGSVSSSLSCGWKAISVRLSLADGFLEYRSLGGLEHAVHAVQQRPSVKGRMIFP